MAAEENKNGTAGELITAELVFSYKDDITGIPLPDSELDRRLEELNSELQKYTAKLDTADYVISVGCGVICGLFSKQIESLVQDYLKRDDVKKAINANSKRVLGDIKKDAGKPTVQGLYGSLASAAEGSVKSDEINLTGLAKTCFFTVIFWFAANSVCSDEDLEKSDLPESIKKLIRKAKSSARLLPILQRIAKAKPASAEALGDTVFEGALEQKEVKEVRGFFEAIGLDTDKYEKAAKDKIKGATGELQQKFGKYQNVTVKKAAVNGLLTEALSVVVNDALVRGFYAIRRFTEEVEIHGGTDGIDWEEVIPFDNRTIARMMSIASVTYCAADMTKAGVRAAIEAQGNAALMIPKIAVKVNKAAAGRAVIAITTDAGMGLREAYLKQQRDELRHQISEDQVEAVIAYRERMNEIVEEYLAEHLQAFLSGGDLIETGIAANDSDSVIKGSVIIQRVLGRAPQFSSQAEFDDLMGSDNALIL
jgi:hypothetical protein